MSVTLDDVRLARKRAYDRVDYWLQKYQGVTIHEAGISIPRIPKDLHPSEYGEWYDYFEGFTGAQEHGGTEDYVFDEYEPPALDPDYHPEPEPIEPDLPEEPEPPEPTEDEWEDDFWQDSGAYGDEWEDDFWQDSGASGDDNTAPDYVDIESEIRNNAYDIDSDVGQFIGEALDDIKERFENIGDMDSFNSALEDVMDDSYLWDSLQRSNKYKRNGGTSDFGIVKNGIQVDADKLEASTTEVNHALQKLYKHFGMSYYREY